MAQYEDIYFLLTRQRPGGGGGEKSPRQTVNADWALLCHKNIRQVL